MSRIGKKPVPVPAGVTASVDGQTVTVKGPKGELAFVVTDEIAGQARERRDRRSRRATTAKGARSMWGLSRTPGRQHGRRRHRRLREDARAGRRRLPRRHEGQEPAARARLQPRRRLSRRRPASPSPCRSRPRSTSPASTSRWSARSPPRSARIAAPSPTRARASATPARRIVRKEGKKK